ncbi:MAG: glycosyltransferase [Pseudomonadota bacterium]|nr:glycosyltransferase [Pseudomonadota bacterium]
MSAYGGAERVIEQILQIYPQADVFTVMDALPPDDRAFLGDRIVKTSFLNRMPGGRRFYRSLFALWPLAVEQFDVTGYDLVISSHHSVAYGVLTHPDQVHVAYVHSPMRYAWDLQHEYLREAGLDRGVKGWAARRMLHSARIWDFCAAQRPDAMAANSGFVAARLRRLHGRTSTCIYPPVAVESFPEPVATADREPFYLSVGRLVPYKRTELLMRAFARMDRKLKIVGTGPDLARLRATCPPNVELLGSIPTADVHRLMATARAYVFAGIEDFGITAVEAQAAGTPVIAYRRGGLAETVRDIDQRNPTGLFFEEQSEDAVIHAVQRFERPETRAMLQPGHCVANAASFSSARFRDQFTDWIDATMADAHRSRTTPMRIRAAAEVPA